MLRFCSSVTWRTKQSVFDSRFPSVRTFVVSKSEATEEVVQPAGFIFPPFSDLSCLFTDGELCI